MMREGIRKGRASISKTPQLYLKVIYSMEGKSNVDTRLGEEIEGGRAKLT